MSKQKTAPPPKKIPKHQPQDKQETIKPSQNKIKFKKTQPNKQQQQKPPGIPNHTKIYDYKQYFFDFVLAPDYFSFIQNSFLWVVSSVIATSWNFKYIYKIYYSKAG